MDHHEMKTRRLILSFFFGMVVVLCLGTVVSQFDQVNVGEAQLTWDSGLGFLTAKIAPSSYADIHIGAGLFENSITMQAGQMYLPYPVSINASNWAAGGYIEIFSQNTGSTAFSDAAGNNILSFETNGLVYIYSREALGLGQVQRILIDGSAGVETVTVLNSSFIVADRDASFGGVVQATNGVASYSTVAADSIDSTGWTNIWSTNNAVIYYTGTAASATVKDRTWTTLVTLGSLTGDRTVLLQPGWSVQISGTGVSGTVVPF